MGKKLAAAIFGILTAFAVLSLAATIWLLGRGLGPILSIASAIAGVSSLGISVYAITRSDSDHSREQQEQAPRMLPGSVAGHAPDERLTVDEYFELIETSPEWRDEGTRGYHNGQVAAFRWLKRLLTGRVPDQALIWGYRTLLGFGALAYLWLLLVAIRTIGISPFIELPAALQTLVLTLGVPPLMIITSPEQLAVTLGPALILFAVMGLSWLRTDSTCTFCGDSFALSNEGTYYHQDATRTKMETNDEGETYSWTEYDGIMLLRCTNEDCDEPEPRETKWTDKRNSVIAQAFGL